MKGGVSYLLLVRKEEIPTPVFQEKEGCALFLPLLRKAVSGVGRCCFLLPGMLGGKGRKGRTERPDRKGGARLRIVIWK